MTTATAAAAASPPAVVRATSSMLHLAVLVVLALGLAIGGFAIGRVTAPDEPSRPVPTQSASSTGPAGGGIDFCHAHVPC